MVIRYAYLWADEHAAGRDEGVKDRPVAVVVTVQSGDDQMKVAVVPVTHTPPKNAESAVEIPASIKQRIGLDYAPSWIVLDEMNVFQWPGPDLRPVHTGTADTPLYGVLPAGFVRTLRDRLTSHIRAHRLRQIPRSE